MKFTIEEIHECLEQFYLISGVPQHDQVLYYPHYRHDFFHIITGCFTTLEGETAIAIMESVLDSMANLSNPHGTWEAALERYYAVKDIFKTSFSNAEVEVYYKLALLYKEYFAEIINEFDSLHHQT